MQEFDNQEVTRLEEEKVRQTEEAMFAKEQEMRAKLVESEAMIPQAIGHAMRAGNLGVMDYYKLKNVEADTDMRSSISKLGTDLDLDGNA